MSIGVEYSGLSSREPAPVFEQAHFINFAFDATTAYDDLPMLPPKGHAGELESGAVLKACIQARVALAELKQTCRHFTVPAVLHRLLPLLEAHHSHRLAGDDTDINELLKLPLEPGSTRQSDDFPQIRDVNVVKTLALLNATEFGFELVRERPLNVSMLLELAGMIDDGSVSVRRDAGLQICDSGTQQVLYTPPQGAELIQRLLGNWESFVHVEAGNLDPLVLVAMAHYQLTAIQPFASSAGVLSRLVDGLLLAEEDLLGTPVLGASAWFCRNKREYIRLQAGVSGAQCWQEWLLFYLKGVTYAAQTQTRRLDAITELKNRTREYIGAKVARLDNDDFIDLIFSQPYVRIHSLVNAGIARRQTASIYLKKLNDAGVLEEIPYGKEKLFAHTRLIQLLTEDALRCDAFAD